MTVEPTRERVEAYEKALRCKRVFYDLGLVMRCSTHFRLWGDLGCPVAVAAARVEAERVADLTALIETYKMTTE
jgi:hypothetical protein